MKKLSLQDQLLKAGLTSKSKAHKAQSQKHKQLKKKQKNNVEVIDEASALAKQAAAKQQVKDRLLNEKRNEQAEQNQIAGQISQLITLNKLPIDEEAEGFSFSHKNKVKVIYVADDIRQRIVNGSVNIVELGKTYEVVPAGVAKKIAERDKGRVVYLSDATAPIDDAYADYVIPDDLMW
jgi:hypothetical protein